jgi:hypothetical protein
MPLDAPDWCCAVMNDDSNKKAPGWGLLIIRTVAEVCLIVDAIGYVATKDSIFILAGIFNFLGLVWCMFREKNP